MRRPARIVDAHVHLWDPARTDWYPYLAGGRDLGMGDVTGMARPFDRATYRAESEGWNVVKVVNVAAATGPHSVDETLALDRRADRPDAIIGGITPGPTAEVVAQLDRQAEAAGFRGVRPMGTPAEPVPPTDVLRELRDRELVFELLARPEQLADAADALAAVDGLTVVVEHAGWPRTRERAEREVWLAGLGRLAGLGPQVHVKLSGVAGAAGTLAAEALTPWIEPALEAFGVERACFASNFPVDGLHGTLDELWTAYATITGALDDAERDALFAGNAERLYRC